MTTRTETDPLGDLEVPAGALYGVQTQRAVENFDISGIGPHPAFIWATVVVKKAAAIAHRRTGRLDAKLADAIVQAADEVLTDGLHQDQFVVDVFQAGAGTSHNMNANELLANRANELLGGERGAYAPVHPNDHVNMAQSTNDIIPTAIALAALKQLQNLYVSLDGLADAFDEKARDWDGIVKSGRTHLQDATPVRLGQEFGAYAEAIRRDAAFIRDAEAQVQELSLGGTAVGSGLNAEPEYQVEVIDVIGEVTGLDVRRAENLFYSMQSMARFAMLSGALRALAIDLSRIANDFRLLASGPRTGISELRLPALQPGSSIMPGKVNPVMAECLNMVCFHVFGNDAAVQWAAEAGQLELNVMMPCIAYNLCQSIEVLTNATRAFDTRAVRGLEVDDRMLRYWLERNTMLATALAPRIGYAAAAEIAKEAVATGGEHEWRGRGGPEGRVAKGIVLEKRRVYQVAKEQKLSSDALISMLKSMDMEVKSHMSVVTPEMQEAINRKLAEEKKSSIEEVKRQKAKEDSRKQADGSRPERREKGPTAHRQSVEELAEDRAAPLPDKAEGGRRRGRRRGKGQEGLESIREELGEKREVTARANLSGAPTSVGGGNGAKGHPTLKKSKKACGGLESAQRRSGAPPLRTRPARRRRRRRR